MANNVRNRLYAGGIGRKAQLVLLLTLAFVLAVPGMARAEGIDADTPPLTKDTNADGHIDQIVVTLDGAPAQWEPTDFTVEAGYAPIVDVEQGAGANNVVFTLTITPKAEFDTGAKPKVSYKDGAEVDSEDGAAPILVAANGDDFGNAQLYNKNDIGQQDTLSLEFSEPIKLYVTAFGPTGEPLATPEAQTAADKALALDQGVLIANAPGGGAGGCRDGNGSLDSNNGLKLARNFPWPSSSQSGNSNPEELDGITVSGSTITATHKEGTDGSTGGYGFYVQPTTVAANLHCVAGVQTSGNLNFNIRDIDGNASAARGGGSALINHVKGQATDAFTVDANANGKIDGVAVTFNHPAKLDSVNRALDLANRFSISTGTGNGAVHAENLNCAACDANPAGSATTVTISFDEVAAWNTAATPSVGYDGTGDCVGNGIVVTLVSGLSECAGGFSKVSVDKARPVVLTARTQDIGDPAAAAAPNGKVDAVEVTFSEPVKDSTLPADAPAGWTVSGYTVQGFHTGATADDAVGLLKLAEVAIDTDRTTTMTYAQATAADAGNNLIATIPAPGVSVSDGAGPALVAASVKDIVGDADGRVDTALLTFSEEILADPIVVNKVAVDGRTATDTARDATDTKVVVATITGGVVGTNAKDIAVQAGAVFDNAGNAAPTLTLAAANVQDLAPPVVLTVTPRGQNAASVPVTVTWSEPMSLDAANVPAVKYGLAAPYDDVTISAVADANHTNGYLNSDTTKWEGTAPAPEGGSDSCLDPTGCINHLSIANAKGADGAASPYSPDQRFTWSIDTIAPSAPPAFTSPANGAAVGTSGTTANVNVSGTSTEPNLTIQVYEGDTLRGTALSNSTGNWSTTLPTLGLGAHALKLRAVDAGGNATGFSGLRTVYVKQLTSTTIGRNVTYVGYGASFTTSGVLRNAGGAPLAGKTITLQYLPSGTSTWRHLTYRTTNSSGVWSFTYKPGATHSYRAIYGGEATLMNATSAAMAVPVRVAVAATQSASSIRYGYAVTFSGSVRPAHAYKKVYLQVLNSNGTWGYVTYGTLDRYSNFRITYKPTARGTRYYRIYYPKQDADHYDSWTSNRKLSVL